MRVLVEAPVALTSAFVPAMVERRRGAILNVASTAGMQPLPYSAGYSAAKAYMLTFSEALHHELKSKGVTVTALAPGPVQTDFWEISGWQVAGASFESAVPRSSVDHGRAGGARRCQGPREGDVAWSSRLGRQGGDHGWSLRPECDQAAHDRTGDAPPMSEHAPKDILPRPVRLLLGATNVGISDARLRREVAGQTILITGASSGIGRASALKLGRAGATVLLVARSTDKLEEVRAEIESGGGTAFVHPCDIGDTDAVAQLATERARAARPRRRRRQQRRRLDPPLDRAVIRPLPRLRADDQRQLPRPGEAAARAAAVDARAGQGPHRQRRDDGRRLPADALERVHRVEERVRGVAERRRTRDRGRRRHRHLDPHAARALADARAVPDVEVRAGYEHRRGGRNGLPRRRAQAAPDRAVVGSDRRSDHAARPGHGREGTRVTGAATFPALAAPPPPDPRCARRRSGRCADDDRGARRRPPDPPRPPRPGAAAQLRYGATPAFLVASAAALHPDRTAIIDELGEITFEQLDREVRALAGALHRHFDLVATQRVALMIRNHRGYVHAAAAATRLGCDLVPLNTDFAGPQLGDVLDRERVTAAIYDEEFEAVFDASGFTGTRIIAWHDERPAARRSTR